MKDYFIPNPCDSSKNLGVNFDIEISSVAYIDQISNEDSRISGFMIRTGRDFGNSSARKILFSFVLSRLEYVSVIWSLHYFARILSFIFIVQLFVMEERHLFE